jgi:hypothetical protein
MRRLIAAVPLATSLALSAAIPATADTPNEVPAAGDTFSCPDGTYTTAGGALRLFESQRFDATGAEHVVFHLVPDHVSLFAADGTPARLTGAVHDTVSYTPDGTETVETLTVRLRIVSARGTQDADFALHVSPNGSTRVSATGACSAPDNL